MENSDLRDLLKDKRVVGEINNYLWIESQKAGYNIGMERATEEWLTKYSEEWMKHHMPERYAAIQAKEAKGQSGKIK